MIIGPIIRGPVRRNIAGGKHLLFSSGNNAHNFWKGRSRDFSFTRASTKTFTDAGGILQTAAVDEIAYTHGFPGSVIESGWSFEGSATNNLRRSEVLNNAAWAKFGAGITKDDTTAPDNATTMDSIDEDGVDTEHGISQGITTVANKLISTSCFAKRINRDFLYIEVITNGFGTQFAYFDLLNGVMGSSSPGFDVDIRGPYADGSFRCILYAFELTSGASTVRYLSADANGSNSYLGTTQQSIHVWGCQSENDWPSSYIPTNGSAVTRALDQPVVNMDNTYRLNQPFAYNSSVQHEADLSSVNEIIIWTRWDDPVNNEELSHNKSGTGAVGVTFTDDAGALNTITRDASGSLIGHLVETTSRWHQGRFSIDIYVEHVPTMVQTVGGVGTDTWVNAPQNLRFNGAVADQRSTRWEGLEMSQS